jgi:fatty-acyl-CoA synthase
MPEEESRLTDMDALSLGGHPVRPVGGDRGRGDARVPMEPAEVGGYFRAPEVPAAFVTLRDGAEATTVQIMDHVRARPAWFKVPKNVEFGELPKTSTGKIQKHILWENAWSGRQRRIH